MIEVVVGYQAAVGFTTKLAVLFFIDALEERALVPADALVAAQRAAQLFLGHVHHANPQLVVGFGVGDQVMQAAPRGLQPLEIRVVQDQVDLFGQLLVDGGNDGLDALVGIVAQGAGAGERLLRQRLDGEVDSLARLLRLG
ncbi:hypothetical protein D9M72_363010 [compost metagenome]